MFKNADYHFKKGSIERELKNYDDAIKSFDESLQLDPDNVKAMLLKGNCYDDMNKKDWALDSYEKIIQKDSDNELAHQLKGQALLSSVDKDNNYEEALVEFNIVLSKNPKNSDALFYKAFALSKLGRNDEAIGIYQKSIEENKDKDENQKKENNCITNYNIGVILSKENKRR